MFACAGAKGGSASSKHCNAMEYFIVFMKTRVRECIRLDHYDPYGLRKGSATHATSGTTVPPPLTSFFAWRVDYRCCTRHALEMVPNRRSVFRTRYGWIRPEFT